jgi:hypothetical protein
VPIQRAGSPLSFSLILARDFTASRGNKERSHAILTSVENAERNFQNALGFSRGGPEAWAVKVTTLEEEVCLQAVDYYLWALQKMYEKRTRSENGAYVREPRYLLELHNQISQIYDMHFNNGTYFRPSKPLTLASRFNGSIHSE